MWDILVGQTLIILISEENDSHIDNCWLYKYYSFACSFQFLSFHLSFSSQLLLLRECPCGLERRHNTLVLGNLAKRFKLIGHGRSCLFVHVSFIILLMQESCVTHVPPNNLSFIFESNINISPPPYLVFTLSLRRTASFHCSFQVVVLPIITSHMSF